MKKILILVHTVILFCLTLRAQTELPTGTSTLFSGSGNCILCHQSNGNAMTWNGKDVSPITYWRSTMMGNSSKDPLWRAMVAEEVHKFPQLQQTIESTCLKCHSPMGFTQAIYNGQPGYSMAELKQNSLANDGVSCTACHQIKSNNLGSVQSYSGNYRIDRDSILYGPYTNSDTTMMAFIVGYKGKFGAHVNHSELCATCHTLFTPTVDGQGNVIGNFPEQTPYIEWKNSIYKSQDIQCQDCHMPKIYDPIRISGMGPFPPRTPFWRHNFVGGNVYMLNLLKNNTDSLGATAEQEHFDSTIARTKYNLSELSIDLKTAARFKDNHLEVKLFVKNLTGHKIPTGIPFRRMWIHLKVEQISGGVIFESGEWDSNGKLLDYNSTYEPHYDVITSDDQVQVYEGVFINNEQQISYTLLRAYEFIKDNRLPPIGFSTTHSSYDSIKIVGNALADNNFNKSGVDQGTGADSVTYLIPVPVSGDYKLTAEVCYQSVKPELVDHLRGIGVQDVNKFVGLYDALPNVPFIMKRITQDILTGVEDENISSNSFILGQNYPNPFNPSTRIKYQVSPGTQLTQGAGGYSHVSLRVFDMLGKKVAELVNETKPSGNYEVVFDAGELTSGIYYYQLKAGNFIETKKLILMK